MSHSNTSLYLLLIVWLVNIAASQAMLPPPMLRAVCGAFADAEEVIGTKAMIAGKAAVDLALKPIAIVGGLKAAAVGTGMKVSGGAIKFVGAKLAKDGALLEATGAGVKGAGLGVAALGLKPFAEKVVVASKAAEGSLNAASSAAQNLVHSVGDTSLQIAANLDSPILGHHHKELNVTAGLETALHHPSLIQQQQQVQQQVEQQQTVSKRAGNKFDPEVLRAALNLVKDAKLEDCVARAICDLNSNPQGFGADGKQVFLNMIKLQGSGIVEKKEIQYYLDAANKGRSYSGSSEKCTTQYTECKSKSADLIKMASHIRME